MFDDIGTLLTNPDQFFEERGEDPSLTEPAVVVVSVAVVSVVSVAVTLLTFVEATPEEFQIFLVVGGVIGAVVAVFVPFVTWLVYAVAFHGLTYFFDGEGEFRDTFALVGWGFAPRVLSVLVSLVITVYVTQAIQAPSDLMAYQSFSNQVAAHPLNLASSGLGILFTLWSAYIWVPAVQEARNVTRRQAAIAVAVPVLLGILLNLASVLFSAMAQGTI